MLTKTELIEKLKNSKLRHIVARTSTLSMPKYKQYYNDAIDLAIKYSNELPDTTELQAENEVLRLALELACQEFPFYFEWIESIEKIILVHDCYYSNYFLSKAKQQILEGKK